MPVRVQFEISDESLTPFKDLLSANALTLAEQIEVITEAVKTEVDELKRQRLSEYLKSILVQQAIIVNIMGSLMQREEEQGKKKSKLILPNDPGKIIT